MLALNSVFHIFRLNNDKKNPKFKQSISDEFFFYFWSFLDLQRWKVFTHVSELFILVPALLGLKGNLDMCLASRLSTQANLGHMSSRRDIINMVVGNIALVQVQATVAAFIVAVFAISVGGAMNKPFVFNHAMLLIASSMFTATLSCFVLGKNYYRSIESSLLLTFFFLHQLIKFSNVLE